MYQLISGPGAVCAPGMVRVGQHLASQSHAWVGSPWHQVTCAPLHNSPQTWCLGSVTVAIKWWVLLMSSAHGPRVTFVWKLLFCAQPCMSRVDSWVWSPCAMWVDPKAWAVWPALAHRHPGAPVWGSQLKPPWCSFQWSVWMSWRPLQGLQKGPHMATVVWTVAVLAHENKLGIVQAGGKCCQWSPVCQSWDRCEWLDFVMQLLQVLRSTHGCMGSSDNLLALWVVCRKRVQLMMCTNLL